MGNEYNESPISLYRDMPDIYMDGNEYNPGITSPNCCYAIYFEQTRETLFGDSDLFKRFLDNAILAFRRSLTYTAYKKYLYDIGLDRCQFFGNIKAGMAEIEMHHNGITIFDIALIILNHKLNTKGKVTTYDIVMSLKKIHKENKVPLIMLCKTAHQLVHNDDNFFAPTFMTFGLWTELLNDYRYGITYGVAKKICYWIKLSAEQINNKNLNAELMRLEEEITKWSAYNEYFINNNRFNNYGAFDLRD